eukprot:CAMPEP_0182911930 /NCGR_PEP_ID=MMETSP0034_2-20130328/37239_1 /TAXON_ID=156128 /ORGANISM="Nephroselmis pyriformis, Strain CCMP717" /LENGTH=59 /DNA_ID=CAMNT_0025048565 /DNA_START=40 /DNA_END=215 /DNA_ORIENTATION=-
MAAPATPTIDPPALVVDKHALYIKELSEKGSTSIEYLATEHLRMSGVYWGLTAMSLLKR